MISLIVCTELKNGIGLEDKLLARQREDMKRFVNLTVGKTIIMGRKTFESLNCKPLKDRNNIILSTTLEKGEGYTVLRSINEVLRYTLECERGHEVIVIGGQQIYEEFMPFASKIYKTTLNVKLEHDTKFPVINYDKWNLVDSSCEYLADEDNEHDYQFFTFERKSIFD